MHGTLRRHPSDSQRQEAVRAYLAGAYQKQLAHLYGRHEVTIRAWIRKAGAQRRRSALSRHDSPSVK
jgi:transposase-like protein